MTDNTMGEMLALAAYGHTLAEHTQPGCECKVETGSRIGEPGTIRDCHWITVDTKDCPIHTGYNPWKGLVP